MSEHRVRADLDSDEMLFLALTRLVEILGEASKFFSESTRERHPQVPWRAIAGTRDRLVHGYFNVDRDLLWMIVRKDLPSLSEALRSVLADPRVL
jgi:uncharacterized protein with HEPN domain